MTDNSPIDDNGSDVSSSIRQVWEQLRAGNARFATDHPFRNHTNYASRKSLVAGQNPKAIVLACSDSRVEPRMLFDQDLGDLFVVRVAGHVLGTNVLGSLEFGVEVLGTRLVVVLCHTYCGAVKAAFQTLQSAETAPGHIGPLISEVIPSISADVARGATAYGQLEEAHVNYTVQEILKTSEIIGRGVQAGEIGIIGATYHLGTGLVTDSGLICGPPA